MSSKTCMNSLCGASTSSEWRKGWALRSGEFANLCDKCGSAFEQSIFCEVFHSKDSGWRECHSCGKRLHCGCIVSIALFELLDGGSGVSCTRCSHVAGVGALKDVEKSNGLHTSKVDDSGDPQSVASDNRFDSERKIFPLKSNDKRFGKKNLHQFQNVLANGSSRHPKQEDMLPPMEDVGSTSVQNLDQAFCCSSQTAKPEIYKVAVAAKDLYQSQAQTNLSITLGSPIGNLNPLTGTILDERLQSKVSSQLQQGSRSRHLLPKLPKSALASGLEANSGLISQVVARPLTEGRARNQLLPRYWPRITDQELRQISGDSNSTIVPLFEKVLSASDAGRIGRLVLPKACAEAYFPPISQPEGLPLRIQDINGKEWVFQFRFWPNNNSRMYVLEGVTPCIQSMKLKAGDTVMFSRMDPEGKLLMGFRKASNSMAGQDAQPSVIHKGPHSSESLFSGVFDNPPIISGYSGLINSAKGGRADSQLNALSKNLHSASGDISWYNSDKHDDRNEEFLLPSLHTPERKRTRNIGSKIKRMLIDSLDALELKLTWEEAQDLLRPPPTIKPSIVSIEDHDFEEYEEPPVFGKRSIFVACSIGGQEQWAQCDACTKWRKLPPDVLLPPKWTCAENAWDQSRCSCSTPDELTPSELENLLRLSKDFRKRRITTSQRLGQEHESSGLDALAHAVILEDVGDPGTTAVATTTKHPRHRPGCSCIVCIQPPSGKGKHKPTCTCNVCMTVKRRFKTLMMRKKKRQSDREAEISRKNQGTVDPKDEADVDSSSKLAPPARLDPSDNEARSVNELEPKGQSNDLSMQFVDNGKGHLDLNCQPDRDEEAQAGSNHPSMMTLLQVASLPLETYLQRNGLTSLASEEQAGSASQVPSQTGESEGHRNEECQPDSPVQEQESGGDGSYEPGPDHSQKDHV